MKLDQFDCPIAAAPQGVSALADHWQGLRRGREFPARSDIDPSELRPYMGYLCILDVRQEPMDFVYRLFGSTLVDHLNVDLTGKSLLELPPEELARGFFRQAEQTVLNRAPTCVRTEITCGDPVQVLEFHRLVLPLAGDGKSIDRLLTYIDIDTDPPPSWR